MTISQPRVKGKLTLQTHLPSILRCLKDGYTQTRIASLLGISKQAISKQLTLLTQHEYIRLEVRSSSNIYEILPRGQLILSRGENLFKAGIGRLHNVRYKYPVLSGGIPSDQWRRVEMVNWTKRVGDVYGVKVEVSEKSIVISPGVFFGYRMADLLPRAKETADKIADCLRSGYRIELGPPSSIGRHEFAVVTPLPPLALSNMSLRTLNSWLDASQGTTEVEFTDMEQAQNFLDIPKGIKEISQSLRSHRTITEVNYPSTTSKPDDNHESNKTFDNTQSHKHRSIYVV